MYELTIESRFSAAHALVIRGQREPNHGHNWRVRVTVTGKTLDEDGLLCDFHLLERRLQKIVGRFHNADLGTTPPFDTVNPTAENVVRYIGDELANVLPEGVALKKTSLAEAPGCTAVYRP